MENVLAIFGIIVVNILLSGDNALVIAMASRNLSPRQQKQAMMLGSAGAVVLRIILTIGAVLVLKIPYLQLAGGLLLVWIAAKLIGSEKQKNEHVKAQDNLVKAIKTIIIADVIMSLDNVLAIAGMAKGNFLLLGFGLAVSVPLIVCGSKAIGILIEKWPALVVVGAAFLGWTGGEMIIGDKMLMAYIREFPYLNWLIPGLFAVIAVTAGKLLIRIKL